MKEEAGGLRIIKTKLRTSLVLEWVAVTRQLSQHEREIEVLNTFLT